MAGIAQTPANLPITVCVGDDFALALTVNQTVSGVTSAYNFTGATITTRIEDRNGTVQATNFTSGVASNVLTCTLNAAATAALGVGTYRYSVAVTKSGSTKTWVAGELKMADRESAGGTSNLTAALTVNTDSAVSLSIAVSGGAGGAGTGDMLAANNLSDVANVATARTNLSVYSQAASDSRYAQLGRVTFSDANYTALASHVYVGQTGTLTASRTVTLPAASSVAAGWELVIADESGSVTLTNTITVARAGADMIDGATSVVIATAYAHRRLFSNGTNAWSFDGGIVRASHNLSDLQSATTARTNLGLGTAATTAASAYATAAQGTTADAALAKASNLSDLTNATTARTNLGLGTAATTAASAYATAAQGATADAALAKASNLSDLTNAVTARTNLGLGTAATTAASAYATAAQGATADAAAPATRSIATTAPLAGGGDLSANRTLSIATATTSLAGAVSALATSAETITGTDTSKVITPAAGRAAYPTYVRTDANSARTIYIGTSAPGSPVTGDVWIDTN